MGRFATQGRARAGGRDALSPASLVALLLLPALAAAAAPQIKNKNTPAAAQQKVEVYGFSPAQADSPIDPEDSYDWSVLSTLAWRSDARAVAAAHARGARVELDGRQWGTADVVLNGSVADAARWVGRAVSEVLSSGLDGVNFDLEAAIDGGRDPALARRYTALVAATSAAVKAATLGAARVTVDVPYLPYDTDGRDYDYRGLAAAADALFVMAYDMQALMWGRCVAAANAPLPLVERSVSAWLGLGVPREKLILGLPWYGYTYECIGGGDDGDDNDQGGGDAGEGERSGGNGNGGDGDGGDARDLCRIAPVPYAGAPCSDAGGQQVGYAQIMELLDPSSPKNVTPVRLEPLSTSLYFNYRDPPQTGPLRQMWFDDPSTLLPKMRVAARQGLRGVGFWNIDLMAYSGGATKQGAPVAITPRQREQTRAMWDAVAQAVREWGRAEEDGSGEREGGDARAEV